MHVSVVIAVKNGARYIGEALESAIAQGSDVKEILVVDDGSTDGTQDAVQRVDDSRVRLIANEGTGVSAARNTGARKASGTWLLFLDADDRLRPAAIDTLLAASQKASNAVAIYGDYDRIDASGKRIGFRRFSRFRRKPEGCISTQLVTGNLVGNGGVMIVRSTTFFDAGGFDETLNFCEDWYLWCRLAALGDFKFVPGATILDYRLHKANTMHAASRSLSDFMPAVDRIFSDRMILKKMLPSEAKNLRKAAEVHSIVYLARLAFHNRNYVTAAKYTSMACRKAPAKSPSILLRVVLSGIWV